MKSLITVKNVVLLFILIVYSAIFQTQTTAQTSTIYLDSTRQVIRGFGAANIVGWRPDMTADEINTAFGTGDGQLGFTILRLRISPNSNDFSANVPTALAAYNMGVHIIASPWSPPPWMKTNNNIIGGELYDTSYASYVAHLKSFGDYMASNGVQLDGISVQNEPDITVGYESCDWNGSQMKRFMRDYAPSVNYPIFCPESYQFIKTISDSVLNDPVAAANTAFIGGHVYGGGIAPYPLAKSLGKELWMTEHFTESGHSGNDWPLALDVAADINDCMSVGMSAYVWWYIVRYYGPIGDGTNNTGAGEVTKRGYIMSQYSRFVRPGYVRVDATNNPGIYVTAYKDTSRIVIVAINYFTTTKDLTVELQGGTVPAFTPYVTSQAKNCNQESDVSVSNHSFAATLDASSITTFVSDGTVGVIAETSAPTEFKLCQNYPNPFNPTTHIKYSIPKSEYILLKVYNLLGEVVATLFEGYQQAGTHSIIFDGSGLTSGVYLYQLSSSKFIETKKLILLK